MKRETKKTLAGVVALGLLAGACTTTVADPPVDEPSTSDISQQSVVSECGGFPSPMDSSGAGEPAGYCDAEVLHWSYDAVSEELVLTDNRIELNCCGVHDMTIEKQGDVYVVTETDTPEVFDGYEARCGCMCVFDYSLTADPIAEDVIQVRIIRNVTDDNQGLQLVFEGELDLRDGSGSVVIDDTPSDWCGYDSVS